MGSVLVVGGTGILRPAVLTLLASDRAVTVVSRSPDRLARLPADADGLLGDLDEPVGLGAALARAPEPPTAALAYLPGARSAALAVLRRAVAGPVVAVLTSAVAAPGADDRSGDLDLIRLAADVDASTSSPGQPVGELHLLVLGWVAPTAAVPPRWHTPTEISAAALAGLGDPRPRHLGVLRPWTQRPVHQVDRNRSQPMRRPPMRGGGW